VKATVSRVLRWVQRIVRLFVFISDVTLRTARFLFLAIPLVSYNLVMQELVWRWWLGYGERPFRVLSVVALILVLTWLLYWQVGTFVLDSPEGIPRTGHATWEDALYYSLVSFSALGYGNWAPQPTGWAQWVGAVQPFFGIISAVALSINLTQRISR